MNILNNKKSLFLMFILSLFFATSVLAKEENKNDDFEIKGFHLDLRTEVMTMPALKDFAKELADIGVNTLIMEWEGTFPFQKHATISNKYAYTEQEVKDFISYCSALNIDVVPLQNCFGHVEYILQHDRYAHLKEDRKEVSQVCPMKEDENKAIFTEIFKEVVALHPSKYFHIGGDETYLLGSCPLCSKKAAEEGKSKLFVDYVKEMCDIVISMGKTPILWADIILKYPEARGELPKDLIFVDWNYGWDRNYFGKLDNLLETGATFWGAPSIRSHPDNIYLTQWEKHFDNQKDFIPFSRETGYKGMVMTSWSTSGTYGFRYDTNWEVVDMFPVRYVYPLSGFRILVAAYGESLKSKTPLNPTEFVTKYAQERFGLTKTESETLWSILRAPQETANKTAKIVQMRDDVLKLQGQMNALKAKRNVNEFEHLRLMLDIRVDHLVFREIEYRYESTEFTREQTSEFLKELEPLVKNSKELDKRFLKLNKGYLYDEELNEINISRSKKLLNLHTTLQNINR